MSFSTLMGVLTMRQLWLYRTLIMPKERCYKQKVNETIFKDMEKQPDGKDSYKHLGEVISDEEATAKR